MIDFVVPFFLLSMLGAVGVFAFTDLMRRRKLITNRFIPSAIYLVVLVLVFLEMQ